MAAEIKDTLLRKLQLEIDSLKSKLAALNKSGGGDEKRIERKITDLKQKLSSLREHELELEKCRAQLSDQESREKAIRDELERREEAELLAKQSYTSIKHEFDAKKKLIRQILLKIKVMRDEMDSGQKARGLELEELEQLQYVLNKELKLKRLIMDNFIPNNHVDQLLPRISFDERQNKCIIQPIDMTLDSCNQSDKVTTFRDLYAFNGESFRPRSEFERVSETIYPANIRFKYDNLIEPKLDFPQLSDRRQLGLEGEESVSSEPSTKSEKIQYLIDEALKQSEPDIVISSLDE